MILGIYSLPDPSDPQVQDNLKKNGQREYKLNRLRKRLADRAERTMAAEKAAEEHDTMRIARKALNLLTYECRIRATAT